MNKKKNIMFGLIFILIGWFVSLFFSPEIYQGFIKPMLSPPTIVFPIAWGILYFILGWYFKDLLDEKNEYLITVFIIMMFINYIWSIVFFNLTLFMSAFIMILIMLILTIYVLKKSTVKNNYMYLYLIWLVFAGYLNISITILN